MMTETPVAASPLGKAVSYPATYDKSLLFPIGRGEKRLELGLTPDRTLPFFGVDFWNAYEVSWLNARGKPEVAIVQCMVPADSPNIVESKSLKLYLNSLNQTRFPDAATVSQLLQQDLSDLCGANVRISLIPASEFAAQSLIAPQGILLDRLDIDVDRYEPDPNLLCADNDCSPIEETLLSHLLKSNCLITGQPDWASIQIRYAGAPINQEMLLRYLIGFRHHNEFHEQCVERIFMDILHRCRPVKLAVYARYTRRGGIDINPWRSNFSVAQPPLNSRWARQ